MPAGLEVYDELGRLVFDTESQPAKILGSVSATSVTNSSSNTRTGTVVDDRFTLGTPYWLVNVATPQWTTSPPQTVAVTVSGNTLTWTQSATTFAATSAYSFSFPQFIIIYGIY